MKLKRHNKKTRYIIFPEGVEGAREKGIDLKLTSPPATSGEQHGRKGGMNET